MRLIVLRDGRFAGRRNRCEAGPIRLVWLRSTMRRPFPMISCHPQGTPKADWLQGKLVVAGCDQPCRHRRLWRPLSPQAFIPLRSAKRQPRLLAEVRLRRSGAPWVAGQPTASRQLPETYFQLRQYEHRLWWLLRHLLCLRRKRIFLQRWHQRLAARERPCRTKWSLSRQRHEQRPRLRRWFERCTGRSPFLNRCSSAL